MPDIKKPIQLIRGELKYLIFIIIFVAGIIFNYATIFNEIDIVDRKAEANTYRITMVEDARADAWNKYYNSCEKQFQCSQEMREDIIKIKVKLGIDD